MQTWGVLNSGQVAEELGKRDILVWDGNYYALSVTEALGIEESDGMVRVGPVHYNTVEEIEMFGKMLGDNATPYYFLGGHIYPFGSG